MRTGLAVLLIIITEFTARNSERRVLGTDNFEFATSKDIIAGRGIGKIKNGFIVMWDYAGKINNSVVSCLICL